MFERTSSSLSAWRSMRVTRGASWRRLRRLQFEKCRRDGD
jgi:hypothetical protein